MKGFYYLVFMLMLSLPSLAKPVIQVEGLFKGGAILQIDDQRQLLKVGQLSVEGIRIVEATTQYVVIELEGERQTLALNRYITGAYQATAAPEVTINRDANNQYLSFASINGRRATVLVDTGANVMAISSQEASMLDLNYAKGHRTMVRTASGIAPAYNVILRAVTIGSITISGVEAVVVEGAYPTRILLGMSYLSEVDMSEKNGVMTLRRKY